MSYDDLCQILRRAVRVISWFAMQESVVLQTEILGACHDYRTKPDAECKRRILNLLERSYEFLIYHQGTPEAKTMSQELSNVLVAIQLEGMKE